MSEQPSLESICSEGRDVLRASGNLAAATREFENWDDRVAGWLDQQAPGSGLSAQWSALTGSPLGIGGNYASENNQRVAFKMAVTRRLDFLGDLAGKIAVSRNAEDSERAAAKSTRVFVVHGHDGAARESVARFLEKLKLEPVILHEQPNKNRTIIEKFTDYADVAFAVVLLTADDVGRSKTDKPRDAKSRARQNVILELGFFLGKLGRDKVCALYEAGVEIPSDYDGVGWTALDEHSAWHLKLARELKAAGLPIDLNNAA